MALADPYGLDRNGIKKAPRPGATRIDRAWRRARRERKPLPPAPRMTSVERETLRLVRAALAASRRQTAALEIAVRDMERHAR